MDDDVNVGTHYFGDGCPGGHREVTMPNEVPPPGAPIPTYGMRVRAVMHNDAIFVHLKDLIGYVSYPFHDVNRDCQAMVASLLERLGEALENDT